MIKISRHTNISHWWPTEDLDTQIQMNDPNDQRKDNYQHRDTNRHSQLKNDEQRNDDVAKLNGQ